MAHRSRSPSGAKRWSHCAQAPQQAEKYQDDTSSPASIDGTHTHTLLEVVVLQGGKFSAKDYVGTELEDKEGTFVVDGERAERVDFVMDYINARMKELPMAQVFAEKEVDPYLFVGTHDCAGTADVTIVWDGGIEIIDLKDGWFPVDIVYFPAIEEGGAAPEGSVIVQGRPGMLNEQTTLYLLGKVAEYIESSDTHPPFDTYKMTIVQPKLREKGESGIKTIEVSWAQLIHVADYLKAQAKKTYDPNAEFTPGEWCKFCPHEGNCKAKADFILQTVTGSRHVDIMTGFAEVQAAVEKENSDLSAVEIAKLLSIKPMIMAFYVELENAAEKRHRAGDLIPGYTIAKTRTTTKWAMGEDEIKRKLRNMGFKVEEYIEKKLASVAALRKTEKYRNLVDIQRKNFENLVQVTEHKKLQRIKEGTADVVLEGFKEVPAPDIRSFPIPTPEPEQVSEPEPALPSFLA